MSSRPRYFFVATLLVLPVVLVALARCSTTSPEIASPPPAPPEPTEHIEVSSAVEQWKQALLQKDVHGAIALYSNRYRHALLGGKMEERAYLEETLLTGNLDGLRVDTSQANVNVSGPRATVAPVLLESAPGGFGTLSYVLHLHKEEAGWKITARAPSNE